ncbi:MAG: hypothetical protein MPJ50_01510 [Pirellulales bacterium]|nr:hypothetical protein [Pirellulales bacterium]
MRCAIGTLAVLFLTGMTFTAAQAQDGWRPAKKPNPPSRTKLSAPVRLTSFQREIPWEDAVKNSGPKQLEARTAQLQAPVQVGDGIKKQQSTPVNSGAIGTTDAVPQTVYYPPQTQVGYGTRGTCICNPISQPAYTTYYAPANMAYGPSGAGSYTTFRPLLNLTPTVREQYVGQGILGQPKVYVPGQPLLNILRYISP